MNNHKNTEIKKFFKVLKMVGGFKRLKRTGWVLKHIKDSEHVADHTWRLSLMSSLISDKSINRQKLLDMSIVHDLGELIEGDIKWESGWKILKPELEKRKKEEEAVAEIFKGHPKAKYYVSLVKEFTDQKTPEAKLLMQLDKLERTLQALEYGEENPGKDLNEFWESAERFLNGKKLWPYFKELQKMRG